MKSYSPSDIARSIVPLPAACAPQSAPEKRLYSFIVPALNEEATIQNVILGLFAEAQRLGLLAEILIVDDGSTDATAALAKDMSSHFPVRVLRLSRNFGKEQAISAGLHQCLGDAAFIIDADLQEPLSYIEPMLRKYLSGFDMVYGVRKDRNDETRVKRVMTRLFYRALTQGQDITIPENARDFRIMDRRVIDTLNALPERNRFMKGLYGWIGFKTAAIEIEIEPRTHGASKFGLGNLGKLALTGLTSFTNWPLRIWTGIGLGCALLALLYGGWITLKTLVYGVDVPGFATITTAVLFLGGVQLISIGILGEYLARIFTEVKGRPGYIIAEESSYTGHSGKP